MVMTTTTKNTVDKNMSNKNNIQSKMKIAHNNSIHDDHHGNKSKNIGNIATITTDPTIITFHLAFTQPKVTKLNLRCIESIFYFHPTAHVILHSNAETGIHTTTVSDNDDQVLKPIHQLIDLGYHIEIVPYTAQEILQSAMNLAHSIVNATLAKEWMSLISIQYSREVYWYSNESNLLRLCILYTRGGIYLDTDVILVRPMVPVVVVDPHIVSQNTITDYNGLSVDNVMARDGKSFECAVMKFVVPGNRFLGHAINNFLSNYNGTDWGNNGPRVFGRTSKAHPDLLCPEPYNYTTTATKKDRKCSMQPLPSESFQPVPWRQWLTYCFDTRKSPVGANATSIISGSSTHSSAAEPYHVYAVHMNNHIFGNEIEKSIYVKHTICDIVMTKFCILCTTGTP